MKYVKTPIKRIINALGYDIVPRRLDQKSFAALYPHCWHSSGFVYDIFGHLLYQNVADSVNYEVLRGTEPTDYVRKNKDELALIIDRVKPGQRVLDVGANIGLYTLLLARLVGPDGSVTAFEPGPLSFSLLKLNTSLNGYKNIKVENKGVTDSSRTEYYYSDQATESGSTVTTLTPDFGHPREKITVDTVSLDDYYHELHQPIDYIKIDIEGGEYQALKGMTTVLTSNPDLWLTIEYAPYLPLWKDTDLREFLRFLRSFGFQIFDLHFSDTEPVEDNYILDAYPKSTVGKYSNLLLLRP